MTVLLQQLSQDREALRARGLMIDILGETVIRLRGAGFAPALELADGEALVVLRLDVSAWTVQQVGLPVRVLEFDPWAGLTNVPRVDLAALPVPVVKERLTVPTRAVAPKAPSAPRRAAVRGVDSSWTPEQDAQLMALRRDGKKATEIAALMGLKSVHAVHDRVYRLKKSGVAVPDKVKRTSKPFGPAHVTADGTAKREWQAEEDAALIAAHADFSQDLGEVAKAMGRTRTSLGKRIAYLRGKGRITVHRPRSTFPQAAPAPDGAEAVAAPAAPVLEQKSEPVSVPMAQAEVKAEPELPAVRGPAPVPAVVAPVKMAAEARPKPVARAKPVAKVAALPPVAKRVAVAKPAAVGTPRPAPRTAGGIVLGVPRTVRIERPHAVVLEGLTVDQKSAVIAEYLAQLPLHADFDADLDLELCEAVFGGKGGLTMFATDMGLDHQVVVGRFDAIVALFRAKGVKALPIEAAGLLLPALRARVAQARGAA